MNKISITYVLEWRLQQAPHYQVTKCGKIFNTQTGKIIKRVINNRSVGYWVSGKFYSLKTLRKQLEKIPKESLPF